MQSGEFPMKLFWRFFSSNANDPLNGLEKVLPYRFKNREILKLSLTHRSFSNEKSGQEKKPLSLTNNNERLEFLGDSVLDLVISQMLIERYTDSPEGVLSKTLASLINEASLAGIARSIRLGDVLLLGKGENMTGGRDKDSLLADAFEAVLAAIYLDGGLKPAMRVIRRHFEPLMDGHDGEGNGPQFNDYKTRLQEMAQQRFHSVPIYRLVAQRGREHEKVFESSVLVNGAVMGKGTGRNKKAAEQDAARNAIDKLAETASLP